MAKVAFYEFFHVCDIVIALLVFVYLIYSTVKLCIKTPWSPLIAVGFLAVASLIAYLLINLKRWATTLNYGCSGAYNAMKNAFKSLFPRRTEAEHRKSTSDRYPIASGNGQSEGDPSAVGSMDGSCSNDFGNKRTPFNIEYFNHPSRQHFSVPAHNDIRYFSYYTDYGRRNYHTLTSSEHPSLIGKFADRFAFYSYFDPNVQNVNSSKFQRLVCGFNFWFKHMWIKPLLHNGIWVVSGIIITITWCIVWEWAACYMQRDEGNYNLLQWSVEKVPRVYWMLEGAFQLIFGITYMIQLYDYDIRCRYILSLRGFVDLTMTPVLTETIALAYRYLKLDSDVYGSINSFGLLFFGPLRFLKLIQAEELLNRSFDHLSDFQTIIIGIATAALSLLFAFSGMMYLFEAPQKSISFITPFDFIYFGVATMGTVGYGDFTPVTVMGRLISIMLICTCISLGAVHFKRLKEAISNKDINMGSRFDLSGRRYVLFWGPVSEYQILTFCRCLSTSFEGVLNTVVVATPAPLESYRSVYRAVKRNTRIELFMIGGNEKLCTPAYVYKLIGFSTLTVVVNDIEKDATREYIINDDRMAILRAMACLNITRHLGIPIAVQMHSSEYATFMESKAPSRMCFLRELKYRLFAKSVMCRGLFYLILTLFHTPTNTRRTRAYVEDLYNVFATSTEGDEETPEVIAEYSIHITRQLFELVAGMQFQLYKLKFPSCTHGMLSDDRRNLCLLGFKFTDMCQYLYKTKNMFLLGIVSTDKCILNPVDYIIGNSSDGRNYEGLVMAMSLRDVLHVSMLKSASLDFVSHKAEDIVHTGKVQRLLPIHNSATGIIYEKVDSDLYTFKGIYKADHYEEALHMFSEPKVGLIVVCGWLYDMDCFLRNLLAEENSNVICLSPQALIEDTSPSLSAFKGSVVYIDGSPMEINDLHRAGVTQATCIIVLNSEQASSRYNCQRLPRDSQVLFVRHLINQAISGHSSTMSKPPHVILDVQHSVCLEYLDPSLGSAIEASSARDAMNRVWQNFGEFMTSYEMASGTIFVQDMFYGLLAHSYIPCVHSVGYDTIEKILQSGGNYMYQNHISLEQVPAMFNGKPFKNLFKHQLILHHRICIGIMRTYKDQVMSNEMKQLVLVAPQPSFIVQSEDEVYTVHPNMLSKG